MNVAQIRWQAGQWGTFLYLGFSQIGTKRIFSDLFFILGQNEKKHGTDSVLHSKDTDDSDDTEVTEDNAAQSERS